MSKEKHMREIKFRAWWQHDKYNHDGAMYGVGAVDWTKPDFGEPERELCQHPTQVALVDYPYEVGTYQKLGWNENCTLMQYTGLKDKNGVEIYEGDIVEEPGSRYEVVYHADGFYMRDMHEPDNMLIQLRHGYLHCEVIGNIYENPELLEQL
jgi:hypothetical protein